MSTSFRGIWKKYPTKGSRTGEKFLKKEDLDEEIRKFCDMLVVGDMKEEYYYSTMDVAMDVFKRHRDLIDKNSEMYKEIVELMRPVMLDCQKVISAIYLWDRNVDERLAIELLKDVRPTWKIAFFYAFKKLHSEMGLKHKGWGRRMRRLVKEFLKNCLPFYFIKYRSKLIHLARWAHLSPEEIVDLYFLFRDYKKDFDILLKLASHSDLYSDYFNLKNVLEDNSLLLDFLWKTNLPFTILKGYLGKKLNDPKFFKAILHTMTVWETILSLKQIEERGLVEDEYVLNLIREKLTSGRVEELRIDPVELLQAYRKVNHSLLKGLLEDLILRQIRMIGSKLRELLGDLEVAVVFDISGSMERVAEWSIALATAIGLNCNLKRLVAFNQDAHLVPIPKEERDFFRLLSSVRVGGSTALGKGLLSALESNPDLIIVISDFEQNVEPYSDEVYNHWTRVLGREFPKVISIKFVYTPETRVGELMARMRGVWLNIPEEEKIVIRNVWDLATVLEYLLNLLPLIKKRKKKWISYVR